MTIDDLTYWASGRGLQAVLIVLGAVLVVRAVRQVLRWTQPQVPDNAENELPEKVRYRRALLQVLERAGVGLVWFVVTVLVLSRLNVPITTLVAPATVIGAAVGFGSQRLVADFLSGFFLIAERQFGFGDVVQLSAGSQTTGVVGTVEELTLRYTRLRTPAGEVLFLPNGEIRQVVNRSRGWSKVDVDVPVPAGADVEEVTEALRVAMAELIEEGDWAEVLLDAPVVAVQGIALDSIDLRVSARAEPASAGAVAAELRLRAAAVVAGCVARTGG